MDSDTTKLISLVKVRPEIYIYNVRKFRYTYAKVIERHWNEIAAEMNCSVKACKFQWTSLRNHYSYLLRENRNHRESTKPWHLQNEMSFLKEYALQQKQPPRITTPASDSCSTSCSTPLPYVVNETFNSSPITTQVIGSETTIHSNINESNQFLFDKQTEKPVMMFDELLHNDETPSGSNALFIESLLPDLNSLSAPKQRTFKRKTLQLMEVMFDDD